MSDEKETQVHVFQSHRMSDPNVPDDVIKGKRFTHQNGKPASIEDLLKGLGIGEQEMLKGKPETE